MVSQADRSRAVALTRGFLFSANKKHQNSARALGGGALGGEARLALGEQRRESCFVCLSHRGLFRDALFNEFRRN